jgi:hypothetical protein
VDEISQFGDEILQVANPRNPVNRFQILGNALIFKAISPLLSLGTVFAKECRCGIAGAGKANEHP